VAETAAYGRPAAVRSTGSSSGRHASRYCNSLYVEQVVSTVEEAGREKTQEAAAVQYDVGRVNAGGGCQTQEW